jgi:NAD(P)-dependent dehydrogenase (short-subunit alcohol dehydrogenase family)
MMQEDPSDLFTIADRVALVTGGSKGIGEGMAMDLARAGAHVIIVSRNLLESEIVAEGIRALGRKSLAIAADVRNCQDIKAMVDKALQHFQGIDILVNNAGTNIRKPAEELLEEDWDTVIDTNLKGVFFCSQAVGKVMIQQRRGKIINIASGGGVIGLPWLGPYGASKAGVMQLTKVFALEWAKFSIMVNAIGPVYIKTPMTAKWLEDPSRLSTIMSRVAIKRLGDVRDLTGVLLLLASDASNYITGQTFFVDAGALAGWPMDW